MMTVLFSRKCEYALQGILYLAEKQYMGNISAEQIATDLNISRDFISKTLQSLVKDGIIQSHRGKSGGFSLARDPDSMSLLDIILIIDGNSVFESCVLGLPTCSTESPCPVHNKWGPIREASRKMLENTTVAQFQPITGSAY
ncbi:MAG: Rrf2 family transcriptional regulator [Candidatus Marinimicrobia bacterium]|nr:Rrf2 family transcriptional regulator [Candidatus Neomarinimicrobiota bacterium]